MLERKINQKEIIDYYDRFYLSGDFSYYSERITEKFLKTIIKECRLFPGDKILDLGCGTGYYVNILTQMGLDALGVDISKIAIEKAKEKYPESKFEITDATNLSLEKNSVQMIFLYGCSVINCENLSDINNYLEYVLSFIKKGGYLVYIAGSNLSGKLSKNSEWFNHIWTDIKRISPKRVVKIKGPYLTHMRFIKMLGRYGYFKFFNFILKLSVFKFKRMVLIFIKS
jgi:ubiquinone/menaquinone biosynthesis C-methylase UbiE